MIVRKAYLVVILLLMLGCATASTVPNSYTGKTALDRFVTSPTEETWAQLRESVAKGPSSGASAVVVTVVRYHEAREKRDLPSSMAREGKSPDESVHYQISVMDECLGQLKRMEGEHLWKLLYGMAQQDFDESLVWTAAEMLYRLSPPRFDTAAASAASIPGKNSIFLETSQRKFE
jgi:hypothetical protein